MYQYVLILRPMISAGIPSSACHPLIPPTKATSR